MKPPCEKCLTSELLSLLKLLEKTEYWQIKEKALKNIRGDY